MRKTALLIAALACAAVSLAAAGVSGAAVDGGAKATAGTLVGAGATFPYPLISKWIPAYEQAQGTQVNYSPIGSGGGIAAITARTVDFGASDAPLSPGPVHRVQGLRPDPVGPLGHRSDLQRAGCTAGVEADAGADRPDVPRLGPEVERARASRS